MASLDLVIIGGGIAGASLGAEAAAGGLSALIVEREAHCGYHSTGRSAAFWLESYGGAEVAKLTAASRPFLERPPVEFSGRGFLTPRGAVHISRDGWAELPESVETRRIGREELERLVPGIREEWRNALLEPGCADIDVAALHAAYLAQLRRLGGQVLTAVWPVTARRDGAMWRIRLSDGMTVEAPTLVNAAGAWADEIAGLAGVAPIGIAPKRRTMVQLRVGRSGLKSLPLVSDAAGTFYFKGEGDSTVWLSPHDEIDTDPCDAAPEELDVALAIDRFEKVVDWPVERIERRWAGLRSFAPDRLPVYDFDPTEPGFFWCVGQGGFGIQTAPAAAKLAAALLLGQALPAELDAVRAGVFSPGRFDR